MTAFDSTILNQSLKPSELTKTSLLHLALFHQIMEQAAYHPRGSHDWAQALQTCFGR